MNHLILIKHSLPKIIPELPAPQWRLSEVGRARCAPLAEALAPYEPGVFVSSVEPKAVETARLVTQRLGRTFHTVEGLHEHDRTGAPWQSRARFEAQVAAFFRRPQDLVFGRETAAQAGARFSEALDGLLAAHPDETLAVFAHGTVITLWVASHLALEPFPFWKRLGLPSMVVLSRPEFSLLKVVETFA